jgi:hypothetical protein
MKINCIFCHTPAIIRNTSAFMNCMCDEEFRTATLDEIKFGFHSNRVYLLETTKGVDNEEHGSIKKQIYCVV